MRRTLVLLLLVCMPLQFSWAAVAAYCQHEAGRGATHLGHHEHPHHGVPGAQLERAADAGDTDAAGDKAVGAVDLDCGHCQGQCVGLPALPSGLTAGASTVAPRAALPAPRGAHAPNRPERPQWAPLA